MESQGFYGLSIVYVSARDSEINRQMCKDEGRYAGWYVIQTSAEGPDIQGWRGPYVTPEGAWKEIHRELQRSNPNHPILEEIRIEYQAEATARDARLGT